MQTPLTAVSLWAHLRLSRTALSDVRGRLCFSPITATCTGCQRPACGLAPSPARSPNPAAGCGGWCGAAAASFPPTHSGAEGGAPAGAGAGRGQRWCGQGAGSPAGGRTCGWGWWTGADWRHGPGCSGPGWALNSTGGVRRAPGEHLRRGKVQRRFRLMHSVAPLCCFSVSAGATVPQNLQCFVSARQFLRHQQVSTRSVTPECQHQPLKGRK